MKDYKTKSTIILKKSLIEKLKGNRKKSFESVEKRKEKKN